MRKVIWFLDVRAKGPDFQIDLGSCSSVNRLTSPTRLGLLERGVIGFGLDLLKLGGCFI